MSKEIQLTQGKVAIVDDKWFSVLKKFNWYAKNHKGIYYAYRRKLKSENWTTDKIPMHRYIMLLENQDITNKIIDHKNGDGLDNRKNNLRICNTAQNGMNRRKKKNADYKGISWHKHANKWISSIKYNGKSIHLGYFTNKVDAAQAYDQAATKYYKNFANINFPK